MKTLFAGATLPILSLGGTHYAPLQYIFDARQEGIENWQRRMARDGARVLEAHEETRHEPDIAAFVRVAPRR